MELTILMPCLNEAETIVDCVEKAKTFLINTNISGEVLISDNGSIDGSQSLAEKYGARVIHAPQKGYGSALIAGINAAKSRYVIMADADGSYDFLNLQSFVEKLRAGYELVMGNRFAGGIKPGAMPFLNKYLGNPVLSFLGQLFFKCPIKDFHCGLRGFNLEAIKKLQLTTPGMEFASEMVVKAALKNLKVTEVPTTLSPDGRSRPPHLRKWRDGWRHLRFLLLSSPHWTFLYPGIFLSALGMTLMAILSFTPLKIGPYALDIHSLLFASAFLIVGLQCTFFSVFGNMIASQHLQLPLPKNICRFTQMFTLEKGIILGLILISFGMIGSFTSLFIWMKAQFGVLVPNKMMRLIIPSVTFLVIGTQIIFSSFFMSLITFNDNKMTEILPGQE
jgi:glycosyltransferase involved in cell wall biosynthesis